MTAILYNQMTAAEQLQWVKDFSLFVDNDLRILMELKGTWKAAHREMMERGLRLLSAFPYAQKYAQTALRFGDYNRRTYRLSHYVERIKKDISRSVTVTDAEGNSFAYVPKMRQEQRKRGRPTREEAYRYRQMMASGQKKDIETAKQEQIARLLGLEVVTNPAEREKNNDELKAEREIKKDMEVKMNPDLFNNEPQQSDEEEKNTVSQNGQSVPMSMSTIADISQTRLHLDQLSWLLSSGLKERVGQVRTLRSNAANYAEQAKMMAERGDTSEQIEPIAQYAAKYTEEYEQIYEDVDRELATVCYRLKHDVPYIEKFKKRFHVKDTNQICKELKPYLQKMAPGFEEAVKAIIEQESPEYIAKVKAEKAKKVETEAILKYLRRRDKAATKKRVETARLKFARLEELMGEEQAQTYKPLLVAIEKEFNSNKEKKA